MKTETALITIIVTLVVSFVSWTGLQIISNAQGVSVLEEKSRTLKEHIIEIKQDVKYIRRSIK